MRLLGPKVEVTIHRDVDLRSPLQQILHPILPTLDELLDAELAERGLRRLGETTRVVSRRLRPKGDSNRTLTISCWTETAQTVDATPVVP